VQRGPYKKDRGPIFSQYGPEQAWVNKRFITRLKKTKTAKTQERDHPGQSPVQYLKNIGPAIEDFDWLILVIGRLRAVPSFSYSPSRAERKKTGRAKVGRTKAVVWAKGEKKGTTDKESTFDLCVAPTTPKCDWLMLDSDESDDRPKLTGRQDKENNWIAVN